MPTVRYTAEAGQYRVAGETFGPGDEADVSEGLATHLVDDVGDFERVHENVTDVEYTEVGDSDAEAEDETSGDICGAEMSDGDVCERPAGECPYHGDEEG